jgi:hypothetical protein
LKDVRVNVPAAILRGGTATLLCHFDLEGDSLYSVKWYKGRREFYRFTPKEDPAMKIFPIFGLEVEVSTSDLRTSKSVNARKLKRNFISTWMENLKWFSE